jgi:hypothetical protein
MYNHDLSRKNIITSPQSSERLNSDKWGNTVLNITWQYVIESWIIRNENEHEVNTNHTHRQKEKAIEKIIWFSKIPHDMSHPYINLDQDTLEKQPINNIIMIIEQISVIIVE